MDAADGPDRFRLTRRQLALMSAIKQHARFKKDLIASTSYLEAGTLVSVEGRGVQVGEVLGAGLVGVVYAARTLQGEPLVYKRARARFTYFSQALQLEVEFARRLQRAPGVRSIRPANILGHGRYALLKSRYRGPTLLALLKKEQVSEMQREALVRALRELAPHPDAARWDLSPKNICWEDGWVLLDTGPRTQPSAFVKVLSAPSWERYTAYFEAKLRAHKGTVSSPSTLDESRTAPGENARRWVFLADWLAWFPEDPKVRAEAFHAELDESVPEDEVLFTYEDSSLRGPASGLLRALALAAWRPQMGPRPKDEPDGMGIAEVQDEPLLGNIGLGRAIMVHSRSPLRAPKIEARWEGLLDSQDALLFCRTAAEDASADISLRFGRRSEQGLEVFCEMAPSIGAGLSAVDYLVECLEFHRVHLRSGESHILEQLAKLHPHAR